MHNGQHPGENYLLAALPSGEFERLRPHLKLVQLHLGDVLHASGCTLEYVYFPTNAIVSMVYLLEDGGSVEVALVGNEGVLGIALFMGGDTAPNHAVVQNAGWGYRLSAGLIKQEFNRGGPLTHLLLRYTQALITQLAQAAVCNRHHTIEQQLSRWLLMSLDRIHSESLVVTQALIANMLGVRREGVTEAAGKLQRAGFIRCSRGHITVIDRPGLEAHVCECYAVVKLEFVRLVTSIPPSDPHGVLGAPLLDQ